MCHFLNAAPPHSPKWCYQQWTPQTAIPFCNGAGGDWGSAVFVERKVEEKKFGPHKIQNDLSYEADTSVVAAKTFVSRSWYSDLVIWCSIKIWGHDGEELLRLCSGGKCSSPCMYAALVTETNTSAVLTLKMRLQHRMQRVKVNFEYTFFANEHIMFSLSCIRTVSFCRCCCCTLKWFAASLHLYN